MKLFRWKTFLLLLICAALSFGGSFSCSFNSDDDDDDRPSTRNS